jgi:hypothetical protein
MSTDLDKTATDGATPPGIREGTGMSVIDAVTRADGSAMESLYSFDSQRDLKQYLREENGRVS